MRPIVILFAFGLASYALAVSPASLAEQAERAVELATERPTGPTLPTPDTDTLGDLPPPRADFSQEIRILKMPIVESTGDIISGSGGVHIQYRGYDITAERVTLNRLEDTLSASGEVVLTAADRNVEAQEISVDFVDETLTFFNGNVVLTPEAIDGNLQGNLYITAGQGFGREGYYEVEEAVITTCLGEPPQYSLEAESAKVFPGREAQLRDVRIKILGRTVAAVAYLVIPLNRGADRYIPEFGRSPEEGYFVKSRWTAPLPGDNYLDQRYDYFTKLGFGLGGEYNYSAENLAGVATLYSIVGPGDALIGTLDHEQQALGGRLDLTSSYQENNYRTAPGSTLWNSRGQLQWTEGTARTSLGYTRNESERNNFSSTNETITLNDNRSLGPDTRTSVNLNLAESVSTPSVGDPIRNRRLDVRTSARHDFPSFTSELLYQRTVPIENQGNFFGASDRTPLLTLATDSRRLFGQSLARDLPLNLEASIGELANPAAREKITRTTFEADARTTIGDPQSQILASGQFRQSFYSDDTAQFVGRLDSTYRVQFAPRSSLNLNYQYLRAQGFTPLSIDRTGRNDAVNLDATYQATDALRLTAQTGYDLLRADRGSVGWQLVQLRTEYEPSDRLRFRTASTYDTFRTVWSSLRFDVDWRVGFTEITAAARYDGNRHTWGSGSLWVRYLRYGKLSANFLIDYNGYARQIDAQQYQFTYDLGCSELALDIYENRVGFRTGQQISLTLRVKAFPATDPFGFGNRGQQVGTFGGFGR
jgi:LPS-assembly protein